MAYLNGSVPAQGSLSNVGDNCGGHFAALRVLTQFLTGATIVDYSSIVATTSGDGDIDFVDTVWRGLAGVRSSVPETWTITFTTASDFDVSGSVSGAQTSGVADTIYKSDNDEICFLVTQGASNWAASDTVVFDVTANTNTVAADKYQVVSTNYDRTYEEDGEVVLKSTGLTGTDDIYHNFMAERSGIPFNRWGYRLRTMMGYDTGIALPENQPGAMNQRFVGMYDGGTNYWYVCDGRRFVAAWQVSTTMHSMYSGFITPYSTPTEYPYPFFVGCESSTGIPFWGGDGQSQQRMFIDPNGSSYMRWVDGSLAAIDSDNVTTDVDKPRHIWPYKRTQPSRDELLRMEEWNGGHMLWPCTLTSKPDSNIDMQVFGVLEGVFGVNGLTLTPTLIIDISGQDYLVVNSIEAVDEANIWALRLS